jgi:glycine/D-amino acid oxidase-like deaminating enzyme
VTTALTHGLPKPLPETTEALMSSVAVIGAGFIGLSAAFRLALDGHDVTVLDPAGPAGGASFGNAGTFASYACIPINQPSIFRELPWLLGSRESPLSLRLGYLPLALPWLTRFLWHSTAARSGHSARVLAELLAQAHTDYETLIAVAELEAQVCRRGCLYVYSDSKGFERSAQTLALRQRLGVSCEVLDGEAIATLEPGLAPIFPRGVLFTDSWFLRNPAGFLHALHDWLQRRGVRSLRVAVERIKPLADRVDIDTTDGNTGSYAQVVIAAGAHSGRLAAQCGDHLPLDTERGYHLRFAGPMSPISRPVGWAERGFYMTPMEQGLRAAGTVELAGFVPRRNQRLLGLIRHAVQRALPDIGEPVDEWLGFRPTLPDGLPVIGRASLSKRVVYAFGHQHLGLTLGALTGALVGALVSNRQELPVLAAIDPRRFHRWRAEMSPPTRGTGQ